MIPWATFRNAQDAYDWAQAHPIKAYLLALTECSNRTFVEAAGNLTLAPAFGNQTRR
jgi:hypothetical protein